ncbi:hypothetical protein NBRC116494_09190 [Aurantivibrio plasticivorans]
MADMTNNSSRGNLIDQLAGDIAKDHGIRVYPAARYAWSWGILAALAVIGVTAWVAPLRAGFLSDLLTLRYGIEMASGLLMALGLIVLAFRTAVPGSVSPLLVTTTLLAGILWVGMVAWGVFDPALEPSMVGKRDHCLEEVLIYSFPLAVLGGALLRRGYVLNGWLSGAIIGFVSTVIPALIMQLACMYVPMHALIYHLSPAAFVGLLGCLLGAVIPWRSSRQ